MLCAARRSARAAAGALLRLPCPPILQRTYATEDSVRGAIGSGEFVGAEDVVRLPPPSCPVKQALGRLH